MQLSVSSRIVGKLSAISRRLPHDENRDWLRSVYFERRDGHAWAVSTNSIFAAVHYLGVSQGDNGSVVVRHDDVWLDAASQSDPDVKCNINDWVEMNFCVLTAGNGYTTTADAAIRNPEAIKTFAGWRGWFPDKPSTAPGRPMFIDIDGLNALVMSSPSGRVVFEKVIDAQKPVIIRDVTDPNWLGVFLARPANGLFMDGAQRPDWSV